MRRPAPRRSRGARPTAVLAVRDGRRSPRRAGRTLAPGFVLNLGAAPPAPAAVGVESTRPRPQADEALRCSTDARGRPRRPAIVRSQGGLEWSASTAGGRSTRQAPGALVAVCLDPPRDGSSLGAMHDRRLPRTSPHPPARLGGATAGRTRTRPPSPPPRVVPSCSSTESRSLRRQLCGSSASWWASTSAPPRACRGHHAVDQPHR